jgi:cytochrome P450
MTDTKSLEGTGEPVVSFNMNEATGLYGHWQQIDELQEQYSHFWTTFAYGYWVLTEPEAIREAFQRSDLFSSSSEVASEPDPKYTFIPTNIDPPEHVKYRHILNPRFSPGAVGRLADPTEQHCRSIISGFVDRGSCDFITEFASVFPTRVFMSSLGLPVEDTPIFVARVGEIFANLRDPAMSDKLVAALASIRAYFSDALEDRRSAPRDPETDFLSHLLSSEKDGQPLSDEEILNICQVLAMAGLETTAGQLGYMFQHLATHPADRQRIIDDPAVIDKAVEEFLRVHAIVLPGRKVTEDMDFHGCPMQKGDMVMLPIPAANRSPSVLDHPTEVDFDRPQTRHIAFGLGPHRCLGLHLARRELATALAVWHELIPEYSVATDEPLVERGGQLGIEHLPLTWST